MDAIDHGSIYGSCRSLVIKVGVKFQYGSEETHWESRIQG